MHPEPQKEHHWLQKLVGEWTYEHDCSTGPDKPKETFRGTEIVRSLGGLWTVGEGTGDMPGGGAAKNIMTLGYDPQKQRFVGTFIASIMTHLWVYEGTLDATGKTLTLDTEGPSFAPGATGMAKYKDAIEFLTDDHRTLTSKMLGPDGQWHEFMTAHYHRKR